MGLNNYSIDYILYKILNKKLNPHLGIIVVGTPKKVFLEEDILIYDYIFNETKNWGIMVGNYILTSFNKSKPINSSQEAKKFISKRYDKNLITITDAINMNSYKYLYDNSGLYDYIKTDLILLTDVNNYDVSSILKKGKSYRYDSIKK